MKIIGIITVIIISALTGNYFALRLGRRLELLKKLELMLEKTELLIRCRSATVYEIAGELCRDKRLEGLDFLQYINGDGTFHEVWEQSVRKHCPDCLKGEDIDLLINVGAELGASDIQGQLESLAMSRSELARITAEVRGEYAKKASLYRSMGVLAGAFAAVLLI